MAALRSLVTEKERDFLHVQCFRAVKTLLCHLGTANSVLLGSRQSIQPQYVSQSGPAITMIDLL